MLLLIIGGFFAGVIDAIAGGGGLITLPLLMLSFGPGPDAIGTNKIAGVLASLAAFLVYWTRQRRFPLKKSLLFCSGIMMGSFLGSQASPHFDRTFFKWLLVLSCPLILWVVWNRDLWIRAELKEATVDPSKRRAVLTLLLPGLVVGFYDGFWGPGGGTFMFLALLVVAKLPLFESLLISKLANTVSATSAFVGFYAKGYVHFAQGIPLGLGIMAGAFTGARLARKRAGDLVRPVLTLVAILLLIRICFDR